MKTQIFQTVAEIAKNNQARFVSFTYRTKGTGELAKYTVLIGASYEKACQKDLARLLILLPTLSGIKRVACQSIIESLQATLAGNNENYTCKNVYESLSNNLKIHKEKEVIHVFGFLRRKTVLEKGEYKKINSSEQTLARKEIEKDLRKSKFRQFALEVGTIQTVRMNGKTIEFY